MKNKNTKEEAGMIKSWKKGYKNNAFTILEMVVVLVVLGILATLTVSQYMGVRERAFDREAQANLRLILAAERTYRMEDMGNDYIPLNTIAETNTVLKLLLPTTANRSWNYTVSTYSANDDFCAQATRNDGTARTWRIRAPSGGAGRSLDPAPEEGFACP